MKMHLRVFAARELQPRSLSVFLLFLSILGMASVLLRGATFGPALHWDSVNYIAIARNLLDGNGLMQAPWNLPYPLTDWPPLYPLLLAASSLFIFDPYDVAGYLNAAIFGLTVFISSKYMWPLLESRVLRLWGCLAIVLSVPLAWMAAYALSESLFILLAMVSMINVDKFLRRDKVVYLVWAATFAAMACMTRYLGVTIIAATVGLLVAKRGFWSMKGTGQGLMYVSVSSLPLLLWGGRNMMLGWPFFGGRPSGAPGIESIFGTAEALKELIAPAVPLSNSLPYKESLLTVGAFGILLLALAASLLYLLVTSGYSFASARDRVEWCRWSPVIVFGAYSLISFILYIWGLKGTFHGVQTRYFVPILLPLFITLIFAVDRLMCRRGKRVIFRTAVTISIVVWCLYSAFLNVKTIISENEFGVPHTLNSYIWHYSPTRRFLSDYQLTGKTIYSPSIAVIYLENGSADGYKMIHGKGAIRKALIESVEGDYFIFFNHQTCVDCKPSDYFRSPRLALVAELKDSLIFERVDSPPTEHRRYSP